MFRQQVYIINILLMILDALSIAIGNWVGYRLFYSGGACAGGNCDFFILSILFLVLINNALFARFGLYSDRRPESYLMLALTIIKVVLVDYCLLIVILFITRHKEYPRELLIYTVSFTINLLLAERLFISLYIDKLSKRKFNARHILIVGDRTRADLVTDALKKQLSWGHQVVGNLYVGEGNSSGHSREIERLPDLLKEEEIDEVVFALSADRSIRLWKYANICRKMGISVRILPAFWHPEKRPIHVEECQGIPFLTVYGNSISVSGQVYKRVLDLFGGLAGTAIFFLLYPIIGLAIKLDSPGPVLFKQKRVGQNGRIFELLKFRSMYVDAESRKSELAHRNTMNGPMFKIENDPRVTKVGRFLRKTSLDEIPQFLNVLKGEMSLVGTRPPTPDEVKSYYLWHHRRISAKPGITGLWQVSGRNKIKDFDKIVELDCQYLDNWRFLDDIKILLKTVVVVLKRKGAF